MESNKLKKIGIKNCTCYYFDDIIKIKDFDFDDTLIDEKSCKNILVYDISYKTLLDSKPVLIRFNEVDGFVRVYDGIRYLVLFGSEIYDATYDKIRSFLSQESCITDIISPN